MSSRSFDFFLPEHRPWVMALFGAGIATVVIAHDPGSALAPTLVGLAVASTALYPIASVANGRLTARRILIVALFVRLAFVSLEPSLTSDIERYLWDGRVVSSGLNPYLHAPDSETLAPLRDERWERVHHREVPTVYPPISLMAFSIVARAPAAEWCWKVLVGLVDLGVCWFLLAIARRRAIPLGTTVWYAWNPVVAFETAGMGHLEPLGVIGAVAAVAYLVGSPRRPMAAGVAAAVGILGKLGPLVALPLWMRASGRPWVVLGVAGGIVTFALAPVVVSVGGVPPGLTQYAVRWEFNGPIFEPLWRGLEALDADEIVKGALDGLRSRFELDDLLMPVYHYVYPQFLAKLLLVPLVLVVVVVASFGRDPIAATGQLFGRLIVLSATVYPWYLLWALPFASLCRRRSWYWLISIAPLTYVSQVHSVPLWPWIHLVVWLPFFGLAIWDGRWTTD